MTNLRLTGPTPLPPEVRDALALPMVSHRSEGFRACLRDLQRGLQQALATREVPIVLSGSGTTARELAIANTIEPGTRVLALSIGYLGERFADIARAYGAQVDMLRAPPGQAIDPQAVREAVRGARYDAALVTHNETSTGAINDLAAIARELRAGSDALILVDAVSSLGGTPCRMDALELDVVACASHKALMGPPGLAIVAASPRARARRISSPRYTLDLHRLHAAASEHLTLFTPAIPIVRGLQASLRLLLAAGLETVYARTRDAAAACRRELAHALFASPACASPTVTSVRMPAGIRATDVRRALEQRDIFVAQGRDALKDTLIRIGHMGYFAHDEIVACARAVAMHAGGR